MEKYTKAIDVKDIRDVWKKEIEKFCEAEKLLESENKAHRLKIEELEKQNVSLKNVIAGQKTKLEAQEKTIKPLQDKNQAQTIEIDFIHKKLEGQQLQIDILKAEKKSLDARFNEVNLKLKQQRQASHGEIPPLIPDQEEKMEVDFNPLSSRAQPEKAVKKKQSSSVPLVNVPQSTASQSTQAKNLKRPAEIETEPTNSPSNREEKRYVCGLCLKDWYQHKPLQAPRNFVKSFTTWSRLKNHVRQFHPDKFVIQDKTCFKIMLDGAGALCDSYCSLTIATGETKPRRFKCNAHTRDGLCHMRFKCRLHYDRHIEIDHANISALDKYSLADLYEKHCKK